MNMMSAEMILFLLLGIKVPLIQPSDIFRIIPINETREHQEIREELRAMIQMRTASGQNQLNQLRNRGLQAVQSYKPKVRILLDMYSDLQKGLDPIQTDADTIRTFSPSDHRQRNDRVRFTFDLKSLGSKEIPQKVEFRVLPINKGGKSIKIKLSLLKRRGRRISTEIHIVPNENLVNGFVTIDISTAVRNLWHIALEDKGKPTNLLITFRSRKTNFESEDSAVLVLYSHDKDFFKSFNDHLASVYSSETRRARKTSASRRSERSAHKEASYSPCSLHTFEIDFAQFGWSEWIMRPKKYQANICLGYCIEPYEHLNATTHGKLLSYLRHSDKSIPPLSCVPTKLSSNEILYIDEKDGLVLRKHKDMIATECGCR